MYFPSGDQVEKLSSLSLSEAVSCFMLVPSVLMVHRCLLSTKASRLPSGLTEGSKGVGLESAGLILVRVAVFPVKVAMCKPALAEGVLGASPSEEKSPATTRRPSGSQTALYISGIAGHVISRQVNDHSAVFNRIIGRIII